MKEVSRDTVVNVLIVSLVTLVIWVWAAGETSETLVLFNQQINIEPSSGSATLVRPNTIHGVRVELRGPARAVQRMGREFASLTTVSVGMAGVPAIGGQHTIDLATVVRGIIDRTGLPVTVVGTQPEMSEVDIVLRSTQPVDILPLLGEGVTSTGTITAEPAIGSITLPSELAAQGPIELIARVTQQMLEGHTPGQRVILKVEVSLPAALQQYEESIDFEPREVDVSVALLSASTELSIPSVPVQIAAPPADLERYTISIAQGDGFLRDVLVRGPPETIQAIADGALSVVAFVHLTSDDLVKLVSERPVSMWRLPPGVTVVKVGTGASTMPRVGLEIVDRQAP